MKNKCTLLIAAIGIFSISVSSNAQLHIQSDGSAKGSVIYSDIIRNSQSIFTTTVKNDKTVFSKQIGLDLPDYNTTPKAALAIGNIGNDSTIVQISNRIADNRSRYLYGQRINSLHNLNASFLGTDINCNVMGGNGVGIQSIAKSMSTPAPEEYRVHLFSIAVRGWASGDDKAQAIGTSGIVQGPVGCGIYGGVSGPESILPGKFAGFFNGETRVVNGTITGTHTVLNDSSLMQDVQEIPLVDLKRQFATLSTVSYTPKEESYVPYQLGLHANLLAREGTTDSAPMRFGFEGCDAFPSLLYTTSDGHTAMDYTGLVPVITAIVQEQENSIQRLRDSLNDLSQSHEQLLECVARMSETLAKSQSEIAALKKAVYGNASVPASGDAPSLAQNTPNPFTEQTEIGVYLPQEVQSAYLFIYNLAGELQKEYTLDERGGFAVTIEASTLYAGHYIYTLVADGQIIDSKHMILTR